MFVVNSAGLSGLHPLRSAAKADGPAITRISILHNTRIDGDAVNRPRHAQRYAAREETVDDEYLIRALAEVVAKQRGYADFYDWREKQQKELGLLEALTQAAGRVELHLSGARLEGEGKDPPDAWATLSGSAIAIEFTEFVDPSLVERQKRENQAQWRWWSKENVAAKLLSILRNKDHSGFGSAVSYWLVIHCDEPALGCEIFSGYLNALHPIAVRSITRCFILLSYDPSIKSYPLLEVKISRSR